MEPNKLKDKHEMYIRLALSECIKLLRLISQNLYKNEGYYFFPLFSIYFRQLTYYFFDKSSPFISYEGSFTLDEHKKLSDMVDIRDANSHLNSEINLLNNGTMLFNSFSFTNNDVQIQFGKTKLFLLKEIIPLYEKIRTVLSKIPELSRTSKHPMWKIEEKNILEIKEILVKNLANASEELKKKRTSLLSY
jgi:hypothetical protein